MLDPGRLTGSIGQIELEFVEREAAPEPLMKLSIHPHAAGISLSDTILALDSFGVERARSTVHNWVQKADLQPTSGPDPDHVALDETVIQLDNEQFWLYAAIDPDSNKFLHMTLFPTRNTALTNLFLQELTEKHDVEHRLFLINSAPWLKAALHDFNLRFQTASNGNRNAVEHVLKELKRQTKQFANHFKHAEVDTAQNWLQTFASTWNQLI